MINLPKGQAFALLEGGQLWKIRMPLPSGDGDDALMPANLQKIAEEMQRNYRTSESWWSASQVMPDVVTQGGRNGAGG
ncbi:TraG-family protein [Klebsiella pneumoniae subsp. ozaenae]|uniref:TraG-family protein n=1 Tax=Klebsiella pneumoniae subsp. ozaenae TaxID=574 RepID=A0A377Z3V1_KLEPO|nr:TraG-family protein [Klebsiella pneumoniae subsp. ozaenae]